jgi:hypothetical protein
MDLIISLYPVNFKINPHTITGSVASISRRANFDPLLVKSPTNNLKNPKNANFTSTTLGFIIGMLGWAYILYEIFAGEASKVAADEAPASVQSAFSTMRWIVTIGWAIYPLGYFMGYMNGAVSDEALNIIYNFADVWNKIAFGVIIWNVAVTESESK